MIEIRRLQPKDLEYLYNNAETLSFDKTCMLDKLEHMMLISIGNIICGIGCSMLFENKCLINWVYIANDYRRDCMGTALVKAILNSAELNGAKTAYMSGSCEQFASNLKFNRVEENDEFQKIEKLYNNFFGERFEHNFYKVGLVDYFKPCSCK
ncbi:MAG: hypothetical protein WBL93_02825 [Lutisporaceae bacterium]